MKKKVEQIVKRYKTDNPFEIAKDKGIIVLNQNLGSILGYFILYKRIPVININENLNEEMQRVVCAHELGHAVLHPKISTPFMKKHTLFSIERIEHEANMFAAELLISDDSLQECIYNQMTTLEIAALHCVPKELVELKIKGLF